MGQSGGLCALVVVVVLAAAPAALGQGSLTSRSDLVGLFALRGSLGLRARDWPRRADPCSAWAGVGCRDGRVVSLTLVGLRRTRLGRLAPRFAVDGLRNLTRLEAFHAAGFGLPGAIPGWLGSGLAPTFQILDISACSVSGEIPASVAALRNLTTLNLGENLLSGQLPAAAFAGFNRLETLNLSSNAFAGALPETLWSLPGLSSLDVSRANLTGALPEVGTGLPANARVVDLSGNLFYGTVPDAFRQLFTRVVSANISGNYFDGKLGVQNGGGGGSVSSALNCFLDVLGQRNPAECQQFYAARGMPYDGPVAPLPPLRPPPVAPTRKRRRNNLKYILIGTICGGILLLAVVVAVLFCFVCAGRKRGDQRESGTATAPSAVLGAGAGAAATGGTQPSALSANLAKVGDSFAYDQLVSATSGFGEERLIKHGHSGHLYHGVLQDGTTVVVKKIDSRVARKDAHLAELDLFAKGLHERLVPFLGHCLDKEDEKVLVYRFVRNGDLSSALHRKSGEEEEGMQSLDWIKRLKIATGVAEALCYLHHECTPPMVHRDVQASSILLDDKFEVRIGSLSEVCAQEGEGHQNVITKLLRFSSASDQGSSSSAATCSYDVYCFGKVLLELVTGKLGISASNDAATSEWLDHTLRYINIYEKELVSKIIDPSLIIDEDHLEEVWAMAIVAKSCLNPKSSKRPPMKYILKALENPLKVVREENGSSSARLRATSSRGSWNAAFFGSWRHSSSDIGPSRDDNALKRSETIKSGGSNGGEHSFSHRRQSKEIFPEPSGSRDIED